MEQKPGEHAKKYAHAASGLAIGLVGALVGQRYIPPEVFEALKLEKPEHFYMAGAALGMAVGLPLRDVARFAAGALVGLGHFVEKPLYWVGRQIDSWWQRRVGRREFQVRVAFLKELYDTEQIDSVEYEKCMAAAVDAYAKGCALPAPPPMRELSLEGNRVGSSGSIGD